MKNPAPSRRKFLQDAAKLSAAGMLFSSVPFAACGSHDDRKLGVALVGLGDYSTKVLSKALMETSRCYLAGIVTGTPSKADAWERAYNIQKKNVYNYANFNEIESNKDIDIVYIVLPNSLHAEYTIRALRAGKHVICEKPMALDANEARQMIDAAKKANRKLAIGYRMHYDPYFIEVKKLGQSEAFGPVNYLECALGYSFAPEADSWKVKKSMGGGSLYNLGVYPIQSARHTKGKEPAFATAQVTTKRRELFKEIPEIFTWQLEWEDGTLCNSYSGPVANIDRLFAGCRDGFMELNPATAFTGQSGKSSKGEFKFPHVFQQKLQVDDFARCIIENRESIVKGEDGLKDMLIIDAIHKSIVSGKKEKIQT